jgi:alanine racemase
MVEFPFSSLQNDVILLKGSSFFRVRKLYAIIEATFPIKLCSKSISENLIHNFNFYKQKTRPGTLTLAMVKAFGYGSGMHEIAVLCSKME